MQFESGDMGELSTGSAVDFGRFARNGRRPSGEKPLVDEVETQRAKSQADKDVDGDGHQRAAPVPDGRMGVRDAHRREQHETEQQSVHERQGHERAKDPSAGRDVHQDQDQATDGRPERAQSQSDDAARRRRRFQRFVVFHHGFHRMVEQQIVAGRLLAARTVQSSRHNGRRFAAAVIPPPRFQVALTSRRRVERTANHARRQGRAHNS